VRIVRHFLGSWICESTVGEKTVHRCALSVELVRKDTSCEFRGLSTEGSGIGASAV
jgi:hypothetical protein